MSAANEALAETGKLVVTTNKLERIIAAIRTINQHNNLGDAVYMVRDHAVETDPGYTGDSWHHPSVTAYSDAVQTLAQEIGGWGNLTPPLKSALPCPFCGKLAYQSGGPGERVRLECADDDCDVRPGVSADNLAQAIEKWNSRAVASRGSP